MQIQSYLVRRQTGLSSPIISTFIIYIYPQLQTNPDGERAALLYIILDKVNNTIFGGDLPKVLKWLGPPPMVIASLILLYLSLTATMAVLFSVPAKQMLNLYTFANTQKPKGRASNILWHILRWLILYVHWVVIFFASTNHGRTYFLCQQFPCSAWGCNFTTR